METQFFTDGFDYQKYIRERLLEVEDLEERKALKQVMGNTLLPFYEEIEAAYHRLEEKLLADEFRHRDPYQIITGIEERNRVDETDLSMSPMCPEDLTERNIQIGELLETLQAGEAYGIYTVYMHTDVKKQRSLWQGDRVFGGIVKTTYGEYPAHFRVKQCMKYIHMISSLYREFLNNGIPWKTVCAPYLYKLYDVSVIDAECPEDEEIEEIVIDFEELAPYVRYRFVPMWNIRTVERKTSSYPDFCLDRIHYLHCIYETKLDPDKDYLIAGELPLWNVSRINGELQIQCGEENPVSWQLREFSYEPEIKDSDYPRFGNAGQGSGQPVHTVAKARQFVDELGYSKFLKLYEVRAGEETPGGETYPMDSFIMDEIRQTREGKNLDFIFEPADREYIFNGDIMSYLVSRLQILYPEYRCRGFLR